MGEADSGLAAGGLAAAALRAVVVGSSRHAHTPRNSPRLLRPFNLAPCLPAVGALSAPAFSGHRLGKWLALPAVFIGVTSGLKASYYRHQGLMPNGMPPVYEGYYEESNTAPHYMKHYVAGKDLPRMS